jgi:hypothetical protein
MKISIIKMLWLSVCFALAALALLSVKAYSSGDEGISIPDTIVIDYLKDIYSPVNFDHSMHMDIAESCGECHHVHSKEINSTCSECHSLDSDAFKESVQEGFPPCSGCHEDYYIEEPEMPGLKVAFHRKCFGCHVGIGELGNSPMGCVEMCHVK